MARKVLVNDEEIKLMVRCAQLYYGSEYQMVSQADVAAKLGISTTKVSRLLRKAHTEGIVRIEIRPPRLQVLEMELIERYGLKDAIVIPTEESLLKEAIGKAAAAYFERIARDNLTICLSSGTTILKMIENLSPLEFVNHTIYPLSSESTIDLKDFYPTQLASLMMTKYKDPTKVTAYSFRLPVISGDANHHDILKIFQTLLGSETLKMHLERAINADIFIIGIGDIDKRTPGFISITKAHDIDPNELKRFGVAGVINYQFYNEDGELVSPEVSEKLKLLDSTMIKISLEHLKRAASQFGTHVIAIAGGVSKVNAIRGALRGKFFNVLVTDSNTAEHLIT